MFQELRFVAEAHDPVQQLPPHPYTGAVPRTAARTAGDPQAAPRGAAFADTDDRLSFELETWVAHYGGLALFLLLMFGIVGLPVPDETLLVFCGYLIYKGTLNPFTTWIGAACGSACGITCSYIIGRTLGLGFIHSRFGRFLHITDDRIHKVHDWFDRIGHWALFAGYYIPGVRHFTAIVAGTSCLEYPSFALFAYSGAVLWVSSFLFIGYHFGDQWQRVFETVHRHLTIATAVAAALAALYFGGRWLVRRRRRAA